MTMRSKMLPPMLFHVVLLSLVTRCLFQDPTQYLCGDDVCAGEKCSSPDIMICINETLSTTIPSPTICNCCDSCFIYQKVGESCIVGTPGQPLPDKICGPGLSCTKGKCAKMANPDSDPLMEKNYQCNSTNWCTCAYRNGDKVIPIYGGFQLDKDDHSLQCACSIAAYKAQNNNIKFLPFEGLYQGSARCLPNGQFDPLQCYDGMCGCIDQWTGEYDVTVALVAVSSVREGNPLCFNSTLNHFIGYYTECEEALKNLQTARDLIEAEGKMFMLPFTVECLPNGDYVNPPTPEIKRAIKQLKHFIEGHY